MAGVGWHRKSHFLAGNIDVQTSDLFTDIVLDPHYFYSMNQKIRGLVSIGLLITWSISALSGFVLYLAPEGQRSSKAVLFLGLIKHQWSSAHTWISFLALAITVLHIVVDWKILITVVKILVRGKAN